MTLAPRIEGVVTIRSSAAEFVPAFSQRVVAGLLLGRPHPRSNYQVSEASGDALRVTAADYATAISVGLNDIELRLPRGGSVEFRVRYWRWASYVLGLSGLIGLIGVGLLLTFDVRDYIARTPEARLPGLSVDQNLGLAWMMAIFWGFVWPWLLILMHKPPLRRLLERLIREVDTQTAGR